MEYVTNCIKIREINASLISSRLILIGGAAMYVFKFLSVEQRWDHRGQPMCVGTRITVSKLSHSVVLTFVKWAWETAS